MILCKKLVEEFPGEVLLLIGGRDPIHPTGLENRKRVICLKIKILLT
jgi:hypothetical protein